MAHQARIGLIKKPVQTRRGVRMAENSSLRKGHKSGVPI